VLKDLKIWFYVALTAVMMLAGCSDDIPDTPGNEGNDERQRDVFIHFRMELSDDGVHKVTRAEADAGVIADDETPGTEMENVVKSLELLVYDADTQLPIDYIYLDDRQIEQIMSETGLIVPIYAKVGQRIYLYAVANPTEKMLQTFSSPHTSRDLFTYSESNDYWDVINDYVPGTGGHQSALESNKTVGIPMTGKFHIEGSTGNAITITENMTLEHPQPVSVTVSRILAKTHVLATTRKVAQADGTIAEYVVALDNTSLVKEAEDASDQYSNWMGWVRLSDVRYMPNGTNKSTYIFPHKNIEDKMMDLNMDLMPYVTDDRFNSAVYKNDFVYYAGVSLHNANISTENRMEQAETFDQTRLDLTTGTHDPNRYTKGMYCLENYFDLPANGDFFQSFASTGTPIPMITHLSIATKLSPRYIMVTQDYADVMDEFIKVFRNTPDYFYRTYGLTPDDFSDADVQQWEVIKERYFSEATLPDIYRKDFRIVKAKNEADAEDIINWSLMANSLWSGSAFDFENGKYPSGTFYVYDTNYDDALTAASDVWPQRYLYITAGAVNLATNENITIKTYSEPHVGGWGYYYTYLDQLNQAENNITPYTSSQVTRNTYYLAIITNLGTPGGTITRPEYIKVNTVPVAWTYGGRGDIVLH